MATAFSSEVQNDNHYRKFNEDRTQEKENYEQWDRVKRVVQSRTILTFIVSRRY